MRIFKAYKSGEVIPASGSYAVLHSTPHRLLHNAVCIEGDRFEPCRLCPLGVLYRLERVGVQTPLREEPSVFALTHA